MGPTTGCGSASPLSRKDWVPLPTSVHSRDALPNFIFHRLVWSTLLVGAWVHYATAHGSTPLRIGRDGSSMCRLAFLFSPRRSSLICSDLLASPEKSNLIPWLLRIFTTSVTTSNSTRSQNETSANFPLFLLHQAWIGSKLPGSRTNGSLP